MTEPSEQPDSPPSAPDGVLRPAPEEPPVVAPGDEPMPDDEDIEDEPAGVHDGDFHE